MYHFVTCLSFVAGDF